MTKHWTEKKAPWWVLPAFFTALFAALLLLSSCDSTESPGRREITRVTLYKEDGSILRRWEGTFTPHASNGAIYFRGPHGGFVRVQGIVVSETVIEDADAPEATP